MLDKPIRKKVLQRAISDITPGKSMWRNVTNAVSAFRTSYTGKRDILDNGFEGTYPRNSMIIDLIQLRSPSPSPSDEKPRRSFSRKKSAGVLDISNRESINSSFEYQKLDDQNNQSTDDFESMDNDKDSPLLTPTATHFSNDDLDDIFNVGQKMNESNIKIEISNDRQTPQDNNKCANEKIDTAIENNTNTLFRSFNRKMLTSHSEGSIRHERPNTLNLSEEQVNDIGEILNPLTPFSNVASDGRHITPLQMVCREIFITEKSYVNDLQEVIEGYIYHLKQQSDYVESIFGNLEAIYEFNKDVLYQIEQCETSDKDLDPVAMARIFKEKARGFNHHYTQYCTNYPEASSFFSIIMQDPGIANFFNERQKQIGHALSLESYLLKPVQRIMKYHLLFQDILKRYKGTEDGYNMIKSAVLAMTDVAEYINEMKRLHENAIKVQEILSTIIDIDVTIDIYETGRFVLENAFKVQGSRGDRLMYLFEKLLLICKRTEEKHIQYKDKIECSNMMLVESMSKDPLAFQILRFDNQKVNYTIIAKSQEVKRAWVQHLKRLILENHAANIPQTARQAILGPEDKAKSKYMSLPMNALDNQVIGNIRNMKAKTLPRTSSSGKENVQAGVKRESNEKDLPSSPKRSLNTKAKEYLVDKRNRSGTNPSPDKEKKEKLRWIKRHKHKPSLDGTYIIENGYDERSERLKKSRSLESLKDNLRMQVNENKLDDQILKDIINSNFESKNQEVSTKQNGKRSRPSSIVDTDDTSKLERIETNEHVNKVLKENDNFVDLENTHCNENQKVSIVESDALLTEDVKTDDNNNDIDEEEMLWNSSIPDKATLQRLEKRLSLLSDDDTSSQSIKNMVRKVSNAFNKSFHAYEEVPINIEKDDCIDVSRDLSLIYGLQHSSPVNKPRYRRSTGGLMGNSLTIPRLGRSRSELSIFDNIMSSDNNLSVKSDCEDSKSLSSLNLGKEDEKIEWNQSVDQVFDEVNANLSDLAGTIDVNDTTIKSEDSAVFSEPESPFTRAVGHDINQRAALVDQRLRQLNDGNTATPNAVRKINHEVKRVADRIKEYKKLVDAEKRMKTWRLREPKSMNEMIESLDSINTTNGTLSPVYSSCRRRYRMSRDLTRDIDSSNVRANKLKNTTVSRSFSDNFNLEKSQDNDCLEGKNLQSDSTKSLGESTQLPEVKTNYSVEADNILYESTHSLSEKMVSSKIKITPSIETKSLRSESSKSIGNRSYSSETETNYAVEPDILETESSSCVNDTPVSLELEKSSNEFNDCLQSKNTEFDKTEKETNKNENDKQFVSVDIPLDHTEVEVGSMESSDKRSELYLPKRTNAIKRSSKGNIDSDQKNENNLSENCVENSSSCKIQNTSNSSKKLGPPVCEKPSKKNIRSVSVPGCRKKVQNRTNIQAINRRYQSSSNSEDSQDEKNNRGRSTAIKVSVNSTKNSPTKNSDNKNSEKDDSDKDELPSIRSVRCTSLPRRTRKNLLIPSYINNENSEKNAHSVMRSPSIRCIQQNHVNNRIKDYFTNLQKSSAISQSRPNLVIIGSYSSGASSDDTDNENTSSDGRNSPTSNNNSDQIIRGTVRSMIKRYGSVSYVFDR